MTDQLDALKRIAHELREADRELREDLERYEADHAARVKKVEPFLKNRRDEKC